MVTYTTTYNLKKPTVADDEDVWGGYLNDSMDIIDDVLDGTVPVTGIDINSGTIDNAVIGGTTPVAGTFTALTANTSLGVTGNITVSGTVDGRDVAADGIKLDGIESGATADQTAAEIRTLVESATDSNVFTDADHTKLNGIETGATADQTKTDIDALGINAATLDSLDSAQFLRSDASDSMSGSLSISQATAATATLEVRNTGGSGSNALVAKFWGDSDGLEIRNHSAGDYRIINPQQGNGISIMDGTGGVKLRYNNVDVAGCDSSGGFEVTGTITASGAITSGGNTVWHAGNDGSGSGLDADTVDGLDSTAFIRSNATDNVSAHTEWQDNYEIRLGSGADFRMEFNGSDTYFRNYAHANGDILFQGENTSGVNHNLLIMKTDLDRPYVILYEDGNERLRTTSGGIDVTGSITTDTLTVANQLEMSNSLDMNNYDIYGVDQIFHHGDTNTYIQFHASDQFRVVTGGSERLEVNSSRTQIDRLLVSGGLYEDYDALSGTTPTCDVDQGGGFSLTMTGNTTFTFGTAGLGGSTGGFVVELTGNGSTVTWPSSVKWAGGTAPDAPASGETDLYVFYTRDGGTNWYGVQSIDAAA